MKLRDNGFTLIEVLTVVAILALLAGLAVPRVFGQIEESRVTAAMTDCSTIGKALSLSMLYDDIVPAQSDIEYLRKWPEKNPWGGSYSLSSNDDYVANKYIRLGMTNVPEQSYQSLKAKMGDQVDRAKDGTVYMYIHGTGGSAGGGGEPIEEIDITTSDSVFWCMIYAGHNAWFSSRPTTNYGLSVAGNTITNPPEEKNHNVKAIEKQIRDVPSYEALKAAIKDAGRVEETVNGDYELTGNPNNRAITVNGNLTISGNPTNVSLYVSGRVTVKGAVNFNGNNAIISRGDIISTSSANYNGCLLVSYGSISIHVSNFRGSIIASEDVSVHGNLNMDYNRGVIESLIGAR